MMLFSCRRARGVSRRAALILVSAAALLAFCPPGAWAQRYVNVVNERFATVSSGPQSALVVDVASRAADDAAAGAIRRRVRDDWTARSRALSAQLRQAERAGLLKGRGVVPVSTLVALRRGGRMVVPPARTRQVGGGTLTFTYAGWSPQDAAFLRAFQERAYPRIQALYGAPAWSGNVEVVNLGPLDGGQASNVQRLAFGAYDVSNRRILLPLYESVDSLAHAYLLLMIHAFHGPAYFAYDAWEQGFARAAASIIARDPALSFQDATANSLYSLLRFYDLLNQPPLGNPTFFPPAQANLDLVSSFSLGKMFFPRLGMSGAAWLKVYIENQSFFREFNAAYYARFAADPGVAGNVPVLRALAAAAVRAGRADDTVEGLPFGEWYERQYVLDTSVAFGGKLYAFVNPAEPDAANGQSALIALVYFRTKGNGDEDLLAGRAYATYFDESDARVNLGAAAEQTTITAGEGFLTTLAFPTPGFDAGRITMDFHAGNETARSYLPSGFRGDFQAVVLGATAGSVTVRQVSLPPAQARTAARPLENGALGVALGTPDNDLSTTVVEVTVDNATLPPFRFNTGDGQYYAVIRLRGGVRTVTQTLPAGLSLVSFPLRPLQTDPAAALGLSPFEFLLSYWDPTLPGYQTFAPGLPTGPTIAPIQAGRGYWLKAVPATGAPQVTVTTTGVAPPDDTDFTLSLPFGWNLVGTPFDRPVSINDPQRPLLVQYLQNDAIPWAEAVARNLVAPQPFGFSAQTGYAAADALQPWQGYWVRVLVPSGVTLIIPGPATPTRAAAVPGR